MSAVYRTCRDCGVEIVPQGHPTPEGGRRHQGRGLCSACHRRRSRAGTLGEVPLAPDTRPARERSGQYGRFQLRRSHLITSIPGTTGMSDVYTTAGTGLDAATTSRAALTVAAHSRDVDECREFLAMLGIEAVA